MLRCLYMALVGGNDDGDCHRSVGGDDVVLVIRECGWQIVAAKVAMVFVKLKVLKQMILVSSVVI